MRARNPFSAALLLSIEKRQKHEIRDLRELRKAFGVTVIEDIEVAQAFFCSGVRPRDPFPLNRQWISAINKLVNAVNHELQSWRSERALSLGVVYAFTHLIKVLSNCPGSSEAQKIDFIESIETSDLSPNENHILEEDPFVVFRNIDTHFGLAKGRRYRALELRNRAVVLRFEDDERRSLTRIPMEKTSNGMQFVR
jgi:hypothetical protein